MEASGGRRLRPVQAVPSASSASSSSSATVLTEELLCWVFHFLPFSSVASLASVNGHWAGATGSAWLWRQWFISAYPATRLLGSGSGSGSEEQLSRYDEEAPGDVPWRAQAKRRAEVGRWARRMTGGREREREEATDGSSDGGGGADFLRMADLLDSPAFLPASAVPRSPPLPIPTTGPSPSPSLSSSPRRSGRRSSSSASALFFSPPSPPSPPLSASASSPVWLFRLPSSSVVSCLRFDLHTLLVGVEKDVRVYSLASGSMLGQITRAHSAPLTAVEVCSEAALAVSASRDGTLRFFDLDSFHCLRPSVKRGGHVEAVTAIRLLPTSAAHRVASIALDSTLKVWDTETGQCSSSHNGEDRAALGLLLALDVMHPSSHTWVTGSCVASGAERRGEGRLAVWDLRTKEGVTAQLSLPCGLVPSVSYCAYQQGIAAGGSDGVVRLFDARRLSLERSQAVPVPTLVTPSLPSSSPRRVGEFLAPASTSPPSPSLPTTSAQSPVGCHLQSLALLSDRLLTCQSRQFTAFASSSASPSRLPSAASPFPYATAVHSVSARELQRWCGSAGARSSHGVSLPSFTSPTPPSPSASLCGFQYSEGSDVLALASREAVVVWNARAALQRRGLCHLPRPTAQPRRPHPERRSSTPAAPRRRSPFPSPAAVERPPLPLRLR